MMTDSPMSDLPEAVIWYWQGWLENAAERAEANKQIAPQDRARQYCGTCHHPSDTDVYSNG